MSAISLLSPIASTESVTISGTAILLAGKLDFESFKIDFRSANYRKD